METKALTLEGGAVQAGNETKPLECNICGKRFLSNLALEGHMQIHVNPEATYDCHICRQEFEQVPSLTEHLYMHDKGGSFRCPHCQKTFTERHSIRKHIGQIHGNGIFYCTDCTKSFTGRDQFSTHVVKHSEATDYMCDDWGEQCKIKDKLRKHGHRLHNVLSKEERTAVAMAYVVNNKEGEAFPGPNADLERAGKKLEPQVEGSYKRNKPHVDINPYNSNDIEGKVKKTRPPMN